jgi:hypothetical protein
MPDFDHVQILDVAVNGPGNARRLTIVTGVALIALQGTLPDKWWRPPDLLTFPVPGSDGKPLFVGNGFHGATVSVFPATAVNTPNQQFGWGVDFATVARDADHNQLIVKAGTVVFGTTARLLRIGFQVHLLTDILAPTVSAISPASGPAAGGTTVTIIGSGFTNDSVVSFGSIAARNVTVVSDTQITVVSPAGSGTVDVTVTTPNGGTSAIVAADEFTYT